MNKIVAVKSYGFEWLTAFGLTESQAADAMTRHGIDWAVVQNIIDPLPGTAVTQVMPPPTYDDKRFRDALRERGVRSFEATSAFFRPQVYESQPDMRPVSASGNRMEPFGWYVGLCPSNPAYLAERTAVMEEVVTSLQPDGVFVSFIRYPGFWELWMPETARTEIDEYCFCERCLDRFQSETGVRLPDGLVPARARILQHELRVEWTEWKCRLIADVVSALRTAAERVKPGVELMINGLALGRNDYDNAVEEILGQSLEALSVPADHFELMFYHQILRREPAAWIDAMVEEARGRTARTLLACLQSKADYMEPLYASGRRNAVIPTEEFVRALAAVRDSTADGVMVYHWRDFLEDETSGDGRFTAALRAFKDGSL